MVFVSRKEKREKRRKYLYEYQKKKRHERRKKHICIIPGCGCKCPPIIIYHQYCPKHHEGAKQ